MNNSSPTDAMSLAIAKAQRSIATQTDSVDKDVTHAIAMVREFIESIVFRFFAWYPKQAALDAFQLTLDHVVSAIVEQRYNEETNQAERWISTIATNACIDVLNATKRHRTVDIEPDFVPYRQGGSRTAVRPEKICQDREQHERICEAIVGLTQTQQTIIYLRFWYGLKMVDIQNILRCAHSTLYEHYDLACETLREVINDLGDE